MSAGLDWTSNFMEIVRMPGTEAVFERLRPEIGQMPVVDSHEHTRSERERIEFPPGPEQLGYVGCDLCGAGLPVGVGNLLRRFVGRLLGLRGR